MRRCGGDGLALPMALSLRAAATACWFLFILCAPWLSGCGFSGGIENPAFPLSVSRAGDELREMEQTPVAPKRPIVVISGLSDFGLDADDLASRVRRYVSPSATVIAVSPFRTSTVEDARRKLIAAIEREAPGTDPRETAEVDVVGFSFGGVLARYAALSSEDRARLEPPGAPDAHGRASFKRLRIARLYCICAPHLGSNAADLPTIDDREVAVRNGSAFLAELNRRAPKPGDRAYYETQCYARLDDRVVGVVNAGLPGRYPWWVSNLPGERGHADAFKDPRILADIARRLRGEIPYTIEPPIRAPRGEE